MSVPFSRIGLYLMKIGDENFELAGRIEAWKELAVSTLIQKLKMGYSMEPLVRTGLLRASGKIQDSDETSVTFGYDNFVADFHHFGTRKMPRRELIQIDDNDISEMEYILRDWLEGGS